MISSLVKTTVRLRHLLPVRPNTPCRQYGCKALVSPPGYCEAHLANKSGWSRTSTRSDNERGYGWAWTKTRKRILLRDQGLCQPCLEKNRIAIATEVDHILSKARGGGEDDSNLQAICKRCHQLKTHRESRS